MDIKNNYNKWLSNADEETVVMLNNLTENGIIRRM